MDYKEKYEQSLERAKYYHDRDNIQFLENIFPELKESEDEKIRKLLIEAVIQVLQDQYCSNRGVSKEKVVAWLEKQGKYANFRNKIQIGDKVTRNEDGVLVNLSQLKRVAKKQGEQKPAEWSEEDEMILSDIIKDLVHPWNEYIPDRIEDEIKWLKNKLKTLKDRVQPQQKQEWSEEDEYVKKTIRIAISIIESAHRTGFCGNIDKDRCCDWLKSLKPQNRWKPSDEQIGLLQAIVNDHNNASSESCQIVLKEVIRQLKKLRED